MNGLEETDDPVMPHLYHRKKDCVEILPANITSDDKTVEGSLMCPENERVYPFRGGGRCQLRGSFIREHVYQSMFAKNLTE